MLFVIRFFEIRVNAVLKQNCKIPEIHVYFNASFFFLNQALQEKNSQLEKSLSSETKLKMDLFSALGDAKRELSITSCKLTVILNLVQTGCRYKISA